MWCRSEPDAGVCNWQNEQRLPISGCGNRRGDRGGVNALLATGSFFTLPFAGALVSSPLLAERSEQRAGLFSACSRRVTSARRGESAHETKVAHVSRSTGGRSVIEGVGASSERLTPPRTKRKPARCLRCIALVTAMPRLARWHQSQGRRRCLICQGPGNVSDPHPAIVGASAAQRQTGFTRGNYPPPPRDMFMFQPGPALCCRPTATRFLGLRARARRTAVGPLTDTSSRWGGPGKRDPRWGNANTATARHSPATFNGVINLAKHDTACSLSAPDPSSLAVWALTSLTSSFFASTLLDSSVLQLHRAHRVAAGKRDLPGVETLLQSLGKIDNRSVESDKQHVPSSLKTRQCGRRWHGLLVSRSGG
ncbi:hypothetical protein PHYPSEUDO_007951 [Phytophthora pseudosyringae]|uniref:Uncharacterized protein n=1 Tax=Phytophthora pseudosyringae TaxID=221518 RepID=A0A8T1WCM6_9STRA|nr:hypothetical protein PHYPSEUDO_007951 [Phytophthora pseudosyringae]